MKFSKLLAQSLLWRGLYFITLFFVNLLLSRQLQASGSGVVFYISNTFSFVQLVAGLCLETGITFFVAGRKISANTLLWLCLLWTCFVIVMQLVFFQFFSFSGEQFSFRQMPQYAFCFITGLLLATYGANLFYAHGNFFTPNVILSVFNLLFIGLLVLKNNFLLQVDKETIVTIYFLMFLMQGAFIFLACIVANKSWNELALPHLTDIKKFVRYSLTVLLFNILLFLVYRVDYYFVRFSPVCSAGDLGNYIQASKLGQMLLVMPQIIGSAVYPQAASGSDMQSLSRIMLTMMKLLAIIFLLFFVIVLTTGKWLFPLLFGSTFQQVQAPLLLLLPGIYGLAVISFLSNFFSGKGNVLISVRAALLALLVVVAGDFLFVSKYGIIAAALVSSSGYLVMFSPYLVRFARESSLSFKDFFRIGKHDFLLVKELLGR